MESVDAPPAHTENRETRKEPNVKFMFSGWSHDSLNLQGVKRIAELIKNACDENDGRVMVFLEAGGVDFVREREIRGQLYTYGPETYMLWQPLEAELKRQPTFEDVDERIEKINQAGTPLSAVKQKLLQLSFMSEYYLYRDIGRLIVENGLEIIVERQKKEVIDKGSDTKTVNETSDKADLMWKEGNLPEAIKWTEETAKRALPLSRMRNPQWVKDLKKRIKDLKKDQGHKSAIVVIGGIGHYEVVCNLRDRLGNEDSGVEFQLYPEGDWKSPRLQLNHLISNSSDDIPEELKAKAAFESVMFHQTRFKAMRSSNLQEFCDHYEDIQNVIAEIAYKTGIEEIRGICEQKLDLSDYVKNHPLAKHLVDYLPFTGPVRS